MRQVTHEELPEVWPLCMAWIAQAVDVNQGDENLIDVAIAIDAGTYELWWHPEKFAAVVQIQDFPRQRVVIILYAGGVLDFFRQMYGEAKRVARDREIQVIRVWGRAGWEKALGMKRIGVILQETL